MTEKKECTEIAIFNHIFLLIIIYLLINSLILLAHMTKTDYPYEKYDNIVVLIMLLLNHIAYNYTKTGLISKVMKTLAWTWVVIGSIYIFCRS